MMNGIVGGQDWEMGWFEKRGYARTGKVYRCWTIGDGMYSDRQIEGEIRGADECIYVRWRRRGVR